MVLLASSLRNRLFRTGLLFLGVLLVSGAFGLFLSASETMVVQVNEDLAKYWRTTYDILVRPPGYRSEMEQEYNLVRPNYLLGIPGGITFAQYEAIRAIPGVEIAAPIAVVTEFAVGGEITITDSLPSGFYRISCTLEADDGAHVFTADTLDFFHYVGPGMDALSQEEASQVLPSEVVRCPFTVPGSIVGVDPDAEEALIGLSGVLEEGEYLKRDPVSPFSEEYLRKWPWLPTDTYSISVLVNTTPYISITVTGEVARLEMPPDVQGIRDVFERGGADFLVTLPSRQIVARKKAGREEAHQSVIQQMLYGTSTGWLEPEAILLSPVRYRQISPPLRADAPVLEAIPVERGQSRWPVEQRPGPFTFREEIPSPRSLHPFFYFIRGTFNVERLNLPPEFAAVPLETYFPPQAVLRYDEKGAPTEPKILRPTTDSRGYFQSPPLILTTLEAARAIAGEDCISAIRVRVAGIDRFSPETQSRIEAVASEIVNRTGLDVDVVVGSSPRPILVHIPGLGYVEEHWVQKGVTMTTHQEVRRTNWLLFGAMLGVCSLFIFSGTATTVAGRVREFGLLKALGWREHSVARLVLLEGLSIGVAGGAAGTVIALGLAGILRLKFPLDRALLILPTGVLLCVVGFAIPAIWASRVPPVVAIRQGEQAIKGKPPRWLGYPGHHLWRRKVRTLLTGGIIAAGAAMLTFLLGLLMGMRGYLALTLLGRYILMRVEAYHWGMVGVMMVLGALAGADALLVGVAERRREIGVLKAVGWRTGTVGKLFLLEGALLGLAGGLAGTALGLGAYLALYREFGWGLLGAALAGLAVPVLVGMVAALYPARVAAQVLPAEAVRAE